MRGVRGSLYAPGTADARTWMTTHSTGPFGLAVGYGACVSKVAPYALSGGSSKLARASWGAAGGAGWSTWSSFVSNSPLRLVARLAARSGGNVATNVAMRARLSPRKRTRPHRTWRTGPPPNLAARGARGAGAGRATFSTCGAATRG